MKGKEYNAMEDNTGWPQLKLQDKYFLRITDSVNIFHCCNNWTH